MEEFTTKSLKKYNGKEGGSVYVAYEGKVYDITTSKRWRNGKHMNLHIGGADFTNIMKAAPHDWEVLTKFPQIGVLVEEEKDSEKERIPPLLLDILERFPMLKRHPHPMTVHFPIVFTISTAVFTLLYLLTGIKEFETTAFHCLGGAVLFTPIAFMTGLYSWWLNYLARPFRAIILKRRLAAIMMIVEVTAFIWRIKDPSILDTTLHGYPVIYLLLILSLLPLVSLIGWLGAELTFPIETE